MKITGKEWIQLTDQEQNDAIQAYANTYSQDSARLEFIIFGKRPIRQLLSVEGAKGMKIKSSLFMNQDTGELQYFPIIVAVDKHGNELPAPDDFDFDEDNDDEGGEINIMGDPNPTPVRCPTVCN